jgi:TfoX/Sxy family transcriptional regulator of competence genes
MLHAVAYDRELAERLRDQLAAVPDVTEKAMFGGLAFLVGGAMAIAASGTGGLLVRADPSRAGELTARPGVRPTVMRGREMAGWLSVDAGPGTTDDELAGWVQVGLAAVGRHQATGSSSTP